MQDSAEYDPMCIVSLLKSLDRFKIESFGL